MATRDYNQERSTFGEHLDELRTRVIYCVVAIIICFTVCWIFKSSILAIAKRPHIMAMGKFGLSSNLQVLSYQEGFYAYIKLCFISALFAAYPVLMYQAWRFVGPGLYKKERSCFLIFLLFSLLAFTAGIMFGYLFLIPIGLQFLIGVLGSGIAPIITMGQYISFVFLLTIALGFVFQLPLIILLVTRLGLLNANDFVSWRKYAVLITFIISAIITPPDPFTQIMSAMPMIALYETGILIANPTKRRIIYFGSIVGGGAALVFLSIMVFTHIATLGALSSVEGKVELKTSRADRHSIAVIPNHEHDIRLQNGLCIETGGDGRATIVLHNGAAVTMDNNSAVRLSAKNAIHLIDGQIFIKVPEIQHDFTTSTPNGNIRSSHGDVNITALPHETIVTVAKGAAALSNGYTEETILAGRQGRMVIGGEAVNVDDIIEWTKQIKPETWKNRH